MIDLFLNCEGIGLKEYLRRNKIICIEFICHIQNF